MKCRTIVVGIVTLVLGVEILILPRVSATESPRGGGNLPAAFRQRADSMPLGVPAFSFNRGLTQVTQRAFMARALANVPRISPQGLTESQKSAVAVLFGMPGGIENAQQVGGRREIPVVSLKFTDQAKPPYPVAKLQQELFDGPWATGTMHDYYEEVSGGKLDVRGTVYPWVKVSRASAYYEGKDFLDSNTGKTEACYGLCTNNKLGELIQEALNSQEIAGVDWGRYDNDGPDGIPNSGDDDGYVDFVAFVHSESGGECDTKTNKNIWSHRFNLKALIGNEYETKSPKKNGGFIVVDDYVIQPSLACDDKTMIQIGVFAHEFGHAFGLPDLYDTDPDNGTSQGIGNWCLMAGGSWGGDGVSPQKPSHMSAWAKEFLGWVDVKEVAADEPSSKLSDIHDSHIVRKMSISQNIHYLLANVQQRGFDEKLPAGGLQVWKINESVIRKTLGSNTVNANENNRGVELVEADNNASLNDSDLVNPNSRGEVGDVFPGPKQVRNFDASSSPVSLGRVAICEISDSSEVMSMALLATTNTCTAIKKIGASDHDQFDEKNHVLAVSELIGITPGARIRASGTLENQGTSYFKSSDRKIVLVGKDGSSIEVLGGLPIEVNLPQSGSPRRALPTLLGKSVVVEGEVEWVTTNNRKELRIRADSVKPDDIEIDKR